MDKVSKLEVFNGILWFVLGILIAVWLLIPHVLLEAVIWWGFAAGCAISGLLMVQAAISRNNSKE